MHHRHHHPPSKSMPINQRNRRPRVRQQSMPQRIERIWHISSGKLAMLNVHAIGVEFGYGTGGDDYAWRVSMLDDVQCEDQSAAESCDEAVVWAV